MVKISGEKKIWSHKAYVALSHRILSDYKTILILRGVNAFVDFETFCCYTGLFITEKPSSNREMQHLNGMCIVNCDIPTLQQQD